MEDATVQGAVAGAVEPDAGGTFINYRLGMGPGVVYDALDDAS